MADLNTNTLTNIDRICYCAGIRSCALGSTVDGGTLFHKGGNRALVYCIRCGGVPFGLLKRTWYDNCSWAIGLGAGWFFPTCNEMVILYSCTDLRTTLRDEFWIWDRTSSSGALFDFGWPSNTLRFFSANKNFCSAGGVAVKTVYY